MEHSLTLQGEKSRFVWIGYKQNCGLSYKGSTIVIFISRVVPDMKIPHITTLDL